MKNTIKSLCRRIYEAFPQSPIPNWKPSVGNNSDAQAYENVFRGNIWNQIYPEVIEVWWHHDFVWIYEGTGIYYLPAYLVASVKYPAGLVSQGLAQQFCTEYNDSPFILKLFAQMTDEQISVTIDVLKRIKRHCANTRDTITKIEFQKNAVAVIRILGSNEQEY